ncbi:MAG: molybdate ABC transporter substrate-binding protein [Armatimonadota bacterium]|nr:molybdate ABC transporter substrate-binding protein [Armatimonadota bacterium]
MRSTVSLFFCAACALALVMGEPAEGAKTLTVFGAASLTEFLQEAKTSFEKEHPGTTVRLNLASSSRLRIQIEHGGPADVLLSANTNTMDPLVKAKLVERPSIFAHNRLVIAVPESNPGHIDAPGDLAKPNVKLVVAAPETPIGTYTHEVIRKMDGSGEYGREFEDRVLANVCSREPTVKAVVAKVTLGEADAGICYASDITPAIRPNVSVIDIPDECNIIADYPLAAIAGSRQKGLADAFVRFVLSPKGQSLLAKHGFVNAGPTE